MPSSFHREIRPNRHRPAVIVGAATAGLLASVLTSSPALAQSATASAPAQTAAPAPPPPAAGWQNGFFVQSANGDYRLQFGAVVQTDGRFSVDDPAPIVNTFTIRKLRPGIQGRIARYFDFRLTPDFANGTAVLLDAYLDVRFSPAFRVRVGKDKTPIGLELLQSDPALLFPERSVASSLVPNRDIGVQIQGELAAQKVSYSVGVFNGIPDGSSLTTEVDTNAGKDIAARVQIQPFRSTATPAGALNGLGFHLGASHGNQTGPLPAFRTSITQSYFSYGAANGQTPAAAANGERQRITPGVFYYYKGLGALGEYVRSSQEVARGEEARRITNTGWQVSGTYVLTGEAASYGVINPRNGFDPDAGRWGALQIVARYAQLDIDRDVFDAGLAGANASGQAQQSTIGLNWYPIQHVKYYLTYERTKFGRGATDAVRATENAIHLRVQLAF